MNRILDNLFIDLLRISVGRHSRFDRSVFRYRKIFRIRLSVNRARGREYNALHAEFRHQLQDIDQCGDIIPIILQGLLYRFAYRLACGKKDYPLYTRMSLQSLAGPFLVFQIQLDELRTNACNTFNTIQHFDVGIRQVIDNQHIIPCLLQFYRSMRADIPRSACHQNFLFHTIKFSF